MFMYKKTNKRNTSNSPKDYSPEQKPIHVKRIIVVALNQFYLHAIYAASKISFPSLILSSSPDGYISIHRKHSLQHARTNYGLIPPVRTKG